MTDSDAEADRLSNLLDRWIQQHQGQPITETLLREYDLLVIRFQEAASDAEHRLHRLRERYLAIGQKVERLAQLHAEALRKQQPPQSSLPGFGRTR